MARMGFSSLRGSKRKKPRSYTEGPFGHRVTVPRWKCFLVKLFGARVMSTNTLTIYKFRGVFYVIK